ncbi:MAG: RidA family protein [Rhodothalassiaceae bacterium]
MSVDQRLKDLGITLPEPVAPVANYVPAVHAGQLLSISGQIPKTAEGGLITGTLGADMDLAQGQAAARECAINILAQIKATLGDLERVERIIKLGGFVCCVSGFKDQPQVINGASDLMVEVFGERGRHSRSAVGVNALPLGVAVEVDALVAVR